MRVIAGAASRQCDVSQSIGDKPAAPAHRTGEQSLCSGRKRMRRQGYVCRPGFRDTTGVPRHIPQGEHAWPGHRSSSGCPMSPALCWGLRDHPGVRRATSPGSTTTGPSIPARCSWRWRPAKRNTTASPTALRPGGFSRPPCRRRDAPVHLHLPNEPGALHGFLTRLAPSRANITAIDFDEKGSDPDRVLPDPDLEERGPPPPCWMY